MASAPATASSPEVAPRRGTPQLVLETMRPRQWSKNAFVLGGLIFSGTVSNGGHELRAWSALVAMCLASGATYLLNDALDAETDRHNPRTASRPIARGDLPVRTALAAAALAALAALGITALINWETLATVGGFIVLQLAYSNYLKHVLFIDVMAISAGFVLRALAGLLAIDVRISEWLLLSTGLLALFLGFTKRRAEAVALGGREHPQRRVLESYSVGLIDELIAVVTPSIVMVYALYCVLGARTNAMLLTLPFVLYGIFRVLFLIHHGSEDTEEPAVFVERDRPLLACVLLWGASAGLISVLSA